MSRSGFKGVSETDAEIVRRDGGGFLAVASTGDRDRDDEVIQPGCFVPLPASIPVHLDHTMSARTIVGRGRPYYDGDRLMLDASLASTPDAQMVRQKMADGVIDSMSIVFRGLEWRDIDGVRTCVRGELLAADLVSVPSQPNARILSMRGYTATRNATRTATTADARSCAADALLALADAELADARRLLEKKAASPPPEPHSWSTQVLHHLGGTDA